MPPAQAPDAAPPSIPPLVETRPSTMPPPPAAPRVSRAPSSPPPRDWWVYQPDGNHIGPLSTESLARACLENKIPRDAYVGATGESWWPLAPAMELLQAARTLDAPPS